MSDKQKKRYYWLKLKENFFEEDTIEWLEEQPNGKEYCLFYLKLCLKSLKTGGILARNVGNLMIPYDPESLAKLTNSKTDTVKVAMDLFNKIGLIQIMESGEIYLSQLDEMVGSETEYARQKRLQRTREDNVQKLSEKCRLEKELELEKELDIKSNSKRQNPISTVINFWEQNGFGSMGSKTLEDFQYWIKDFEKIGTTTTAAIELILYALEIAVNNGVKKYAYVNSILQSWESSLFKSVDQVKAEDKKKSPKQANQLENTGSSEYDDVGW